MVFERVFTVNDYYDGPHSGIANYCGRPHHYECEWDHEKGNYGSTFVLTPITNETLTLALEQHEIFLRWERANLRGEIVDSTHPALPGQNARYAELEEIIKGSLENASGSRHRARGVFRPTPEQQPSLPKGVMRELEVEWANVA
ncbi:MAG TPA: hypothetical protein VFX97_17810 [Pyrinomonadaceae bacterium]|nr:hypothetical protein [Pyrinomonadaceae bacterium]